MFTFEKHVLYCCNDLLLSMLFILCNLTLLASYDLPVGTRLLSILATFSLGTTAIPPFVLYVNNYNTIFGYRYQFDLSCELSSDLRSYFTKSYYHLNQ